MKMANMERLVFKGTVDEIDVGRLREGMDAELKVGALPLAKINGMLSKISLKAEKKENATVFPIEVTVPKGSNCDTAGRLLGEREYLHPAEGQRADDPGAVRDVPERFCVRPHPGRCEGGRRTTDHDRTERRDQDRSDDRLEGR